MFHLGNLEGVFEQIYGLAILGIGLLMLFNLDGDLIDDAPGYYLLPCQPNPCLLIRSLSEEEIKVQ